MEKGKIINLQVSKKKGTIFGHIHARGRNFDIHSNKFNLTIEMNNQECEVEIKNGNKLTSVLYKGKQIMKNPIIKRQSQTKVIKEKSPKKFNKVKTEKRYTIQIPNAFAPYNFIPLNKNVVSINKPKNFDKYYRDKNTGYIEVEIETKTPIYIRGEGSDFYKQADKYRIPGSSLRGMIRSLIEIVSWSKFGFSQVKDKKERRYFYRKFTDKSKNLEEQYRKSIVGGDNKNGYFNKVNAGYITRTSLFEYRITPAKKINNTQFFRVEDEDVVNAGLNKPISVSYSKYDNRKKREIIKYKLNSAYKEKEEKVLFVPADIETHQHSVKMKYAKVTSIRKYSDLKEENEEEGYLICSGYVPSKNKGKHLHWIIGPKSQGPSIKIPDNVIKDFNDNFDYKKRISGMSKENKIKKLKINSNSIPCFYVTDNQGNIKSFGFTGHYSLPYEKTLQDFIGKEHLYEDKIDISTAIFGKEEKFMTRLFFEDLILNEDDYDKIQETEKSPKILSEPKPTSFQIYLKQNTDKIIPIFNKMGKINGWKNIKSYNDETKIRGNKLYWHKENPEWFEDVITLNKFAFEKYLNDNSINSNIFENAVVKNTRSKIQIDLKKLSENAYLLIMEIIKKEMNEEKRKIESQHSVIKPINSGAKFSGRIRFENLSNEELGALLFALDLPEGCYHKIGMGKPLGLGSIKIKPILYLSNRKERYQNLFNELDGLKPTSQKKIESLKKDFEKFMLKEIQESNKNSLWEVDRLKELKKMLTFNHNIDYRKISYMELKRFENREVLPKPTEVN